MQTAPIRGRKKGTFRLHGLRRERLQHNFSIRELAWLSDLSPDTVWRLEKLERGAEGRTRRTLAEALGTTISELRRPDTEEERKSITM